MGKPTVLTLALKTRLRAIHPAVSQSRALHVRSASVHQTTPPGLCAFQEPHCRRWADSSVPADRAGVAEGGAGLSPGSGAFGPVPTSPQAAFTAAPPRPRDAAAATSG